ncbi:MAG: amino acid adenylation domain-containing protein [Acidobacteriota bacterium]
MVFCGGEPLTVELAEKFWRSLDAELYHQYGPTETTVDVTFWHCQRTNGDQVIPIGRPIANTQIFILDKQLEPVPIGVAGELCIGGVGLARGYLNRADLTADKFIPNPYSNEAGTRLYRTGDLARYLSDGNIEFIGRIDQQVKVRGYRIELGEIESVLLNHTDVRDTIVIAREDRPSNKQLVAYLIMEQDSTVNINELRAYLKEKLPEYMLPSAFVMMECLPLTPNGKVNRRALPAPQLADTMIASEGYLAARSPIEEIVVEIWASVLNIEQIGVNDNFFELGGHSLLATQVISRFRAIFSLEVPLRSIFETPTVAGLAEQIQVLKRTEQGLIIPPIVPVTRKQDLPLSFAQQRLWFLDQFEPGNPTYNMFAAVRLKGTLNVTVLAQSINEIVRRHESLRTLFINVNGQPKQEILSELNILLLVIDIVMLPEQELNTELTRIAAELRQHSFNLATGPLIRTLLLRINDKDHALLMNMHHIVSDGWSIRIFVRELVTLYTSFSTGKPSLLAEMPIQYADYANWQQEWLRGDVLEQQLGYWQKQLAGELPVLQLSTDFARPPLQTYRGATRVILLDKQLVAELKMLSRREGATLFMTLLAAFNILMQRYSGQEDIIVGSPIAGRNRAEIEGLIGCFLNIVPLRTDLSGEPSFVELMQRVRECALQAYAHQDIPFEKLLEHLQPARDLSRTPVFQVFFNMLNLHSEHTQIAGLSVEPLVNAEARAKFDLTLYLREQYDSIKLEMVYNADLFSSERVEEMLEQYQRLLVEIVAEPTSRVSSYSLLTNKTKTVLPNPTEPLSDKWEGSVSRLFEAQAAQVPTQIAVQDERSKWTYQQLNERSNQLAHYLISKDLRPADVVAIYGQRNATLVWTLLGVMKAGAAFVILDPTYPATRLIDYLEIAEVQGWIGLLPAEMVAAELTEYVEQQQYRCCIDLSSETELAVLTSQCSDNLAITVAANELAYIAFTSGSTGKPKGVMGRQGSLTHFLPWLKEQFGLNEKDRFSMLSGLSHDPLHRDIFTPLCLGARICIPDEQYMREPLRLAQWMRDEGVSIAHLTPAMAQLLTQAGAEIRITALRYAFLVGDVLTWRDVKRLKELATEVQCVNYYGSTETQRAVGYHLVTMSESQVEKQKEILPLGRGIKDVQLLVLNASRQMCGIGEVGEIYIRSPHIALGYIGDEELTRARFITNPFTGQETDLIYRTGDLGCYLPNGIVEPLGRADQQVKIRGYRVELGEIEAVIGEQEGVAEAVVIARQYEDGEKRLVGYLVAKPEVVMVTTQLREQLKKRLPEYMIPSAYLVLEKLPLTPNGKVDRKALPAPEQLSTQLAANYIAPQTELERGIAAIWQELLKLEKVGIHDNFFELGGHSLLIVQVQSKLQTRFGYNLPIVEFFKNPTISSLALFLSQQEQKQKEPLSLQQIDERARKRKEAIDQKRHFAKQKR